jgi:DNA-binding LacI/PurR family transcriptional regulator
MIEVMTTPTVPGPQRGREPAMTDVAALAGVSHQTVSRVLNNHPNVAERTRLRVLAAITELGYRPNRAAKALVTGRSQTLGVVAQNSTLFGPASLMAAVILAAAEAGFAASVASVRELDRDSFRDAVERLLDQRVAGIVVITPVETATPAIEAVAPDVPLVVIDGDATLPRPLVTVDQVEGARLATQHLLDAGHRTVWHVAGPWEWFDSRGRLEGWRRTLEQAGAEVPPLVHGQWTPESGYQAGLMLARMPEVTAVFAANDHMALGVLRALHERGRAVPDEVSVVGYDDVPEAAYFIPPLTTVRPDFDAVARSGLRLVLDRLDGVVPPHKITVPPVLVTRDSVRPPAVRRG